MSTHIVIRHVAALTAALLLGGTALAGCSGSDSGGGDAKTIVFWSSQMSTSVEADKKLREQEFTKFTRQTGINVQVEVIGWGDLYKRILTAVSSGQGPDVLEIGNTWAVPLQATGAFLPFGGEEISAIGGKERFFPTSMTATGAPGEDPTSIPVYGLAYGLFYNTKLFKAAGITKPPATWAEMVADAKKLTKDTNGDGKPDQWGLALEAGSVTENAHFAFILGRQQGSSLFDGAKPTFDTSQQVAAVKQYVDLMTVDKVVSPSNAEYAASNAVDDVVAGKAAMVISQTGSRQNFKNRKMNDYAVAQVPVLSPLPAGGKPTQSHVAGINLSIFKSTKNKQASLDLVKFMTSDEEQAIFNQTLGTLPVVNAAYDKPAFKTAELQVFKTVLAEHSEPMPLIPAEGEMETILGTELKNLFAKAATGGSLGEADIKAALTRANTQMAAAG